MTETRTYTEAVLDFSDRLDVVEQRIIRKLDVIVADNSEFKAALATGNAKFDAIDKRVDAACKVMNLRIDDCVTDIDANTASITKVRNLNAFLSAAFSAVAGLVGIQK